MDVRKALRFLGYALHRTGTFGLSCEHTFSRFGMYLGIERLCRNRVFDGPAFSVSHSRHLLSFMSLRRGIEVTDADYPQVNLLNLPYGDNTFGVVVSDQVFEYIKGSPIQAFAESLRVLKPGGWVLHTTCFLTPYHGPGDYWRFSPEGLEELAKMSGASEAHAGGHGHPGEFIINLLGWRWLPVPQASWHPFRKLASLNRVSYQTTVWVLARK